MEQVASWYAILRIWRGCWFLESKLEMPREWLLFTNPMPSLMSEADS